MEVYQKGSPQIIQDKQYSNHFKPLVLEDPPFEETSICLDVHCAGRQRSQPESTITVGQYTRSGSGGAKTLGENDVNCELLTVMTRNTSYRFISTNKTPSIDIYRMYSPL